MPVDRLVEISAAGAKLQGNLNIPDDPLGLVVFAHGSGSSRFSPRNRFVAGELQQARLGTLLVDLLTTGEESLDDVTAEYRFDIPLLSTRVVDTVDWLSGQDDMRHLPLGTFGASTGAAAALITAAERPDRVAAVVSRGGRPDLAAEVLPRVKAPTLLIVGGNDLPVIRLNRDALDLLRSEKRMQVIPGATHLFEEPGALEEVAILARDWFASHFPAAGKRAA